MLRYTAIYQYQYNLRSVGYHLRMSIPNTSLLCLEQLKLWRELDVLPDNWDNEGLNKSH